MCSAVPSRRLVLLLFAATAFAQPSAPTQKCVFAGVVQDSLSGQRLPRAQVSLHPVVRGSAIFGTHSNAGGAFRLEAVEPGDYRIQVGESDHALATTVLLKPGQAISVVHCSAGLSITGAVAALDPKSFVSGHVTDPDGEPIAGAVVAAMQENWTRGMPIYYRMEGTTDERGAYRLSVLPGHYYVAAGVRPAGGVPAVFSEGPGKPDLRVATCVYPDAPSIAAATPIEIRAGQQYGGIDVRLRTLPVYHVRGAVRPWGSWNGPKNLLLSADESGFMDHSVNLDKDGGFDIAGVLPGTYWLRAFEMSLNGNKVAVEVSDHDVEGVIFGAVPPVEIKGRLRFEDGAPHDLSKLHVHLTRLDTGFPLADQETDVRVDGSFEFHRLSAAFTAVEVSPMVDYYIRAATLNQREVENGRLDLSAGGPGELEIVLSTGTGTVNGRVRDAAGLAAEAVLAPASGVTGNTRARSVEIDAEGRFRFQHVPSGRYYVWAVPHFDDGHWQNMDFVTRMQTRGIAVELEKNGAVEVEIPAVVE